MPKVSVPIAQGYYESPSLPINSQRCVNFFPNITQSQSPFPEALLGIEGASQLLTTGAVNSENRGGWVKNGVPYFVNGTTLYSVTRTISGTGEESFTANSLGTVEGEARCSFADNGAQLLVLVPNGKGYIYNENAGTPFQEITDTDFTTTNGKPQGVVFIDSFFVVFTDTKKIKKSAANDGLTWEPLDFGSAESDPDEIVGMEVFRNQIYVMGSETIEVFQNAGLGGFPFQRQGFAIQKGLSAQFAVTVASDTLMWLGAGKNESPSIWQLSGNDAQKISTIAIDNYLSSLSDTAISNCFAWNYSESGHFFVGFSFPNRTFVYDQSTQRWHERESRIVNNRGIDEDVRWRHNCFVKAYGRILVGDSQDGRIGEISDSIYIEYDRPIISKVSTAPLYDLGNPMSVTRCELVVESGVGDYDLTPNPEVRMSASRDGRVFNDPQSRSMGAKGEYNHRCVWRRLGRFPQYSVFEFAVSDPVKKAFLGLELTIAQGHKRNG